MPIFQMILHARSRLAAQQARASGQDMLLYLVFSRERIHAAALLSFYIIIPMNFPTMCPESHNLNTTENFIFFCTRPFPSRNNGGLAAPSFAHASALAG